MSDEKRDEERAQRDKDRSEEAHWQVAEAAAEEERRSQGARQRGKQEQPQQAWEDEGGALDQEP